MLHIIIIVGNILKIHKISLELQIHYYLYKFLGATKIDKCEMQILVVNFQNQVIPMTESYDNQKNMAKKCNAVMHHTFPSSLSHS